MLRFTNGGHGIHEGFYLAGYRAHASGRFKYDGVRAIESDCYIFVNPSTFDDVCANNL